MLDSKIIERRVLWCSCPESFPSPHSTVACGRADRANSREIRYPNGEGIPEAFDFPGFRVALAIASLPEMTFESWRVFLGHCTGVLG
jgi:hypothetical protein